MNVLITGNLFSIATSLAKKLAKEKNRTVLACSNFEALDTDIKNTIAHSISPEDELFQDALSSYNFDAVVYLATREEQLKDAYDQVGGQHLDGLKNTLELCRKENVKRFIYISSTEIYGTMKEASEDVAPQPASINGYTLFAGEQYCKFYQNEFGLNVTIVRLPYIYGIDEKGSYLYKLLQDCKNQDNVSIPGSANRVCSFLHANDVADFLTRALDEEYSQAASVVNLSSSITLSNLKLSELLSKYFDANFVFDDDAKVYTRSVAVTTAKKVFDWVDLHDVRTELQEYVDLVHGISQPKQLSLRGMLRELSVHTEILKWLELLLGAALMQFLSQLTGTLIQYKYIDFRLLFVVVMASVYGFQFGVLAAFLVSLSLIYTWYQLAIDWTLLIYNVGNWFPLALYFVTGLIIGYNHDRADTVVVNAKKQTTLIYDKYKFLYEVFSEVRKLKDEFREQVIGYRDSFGKIYTITRELDTLQEHAVYFRALTILEDLMENNNIAIYSLDPDSVYARLEVNSTSLSEKLAKSLKLSDFPEAVKSIEEGVIFQNTLLLPNYPAYIAPVLNYSYPFNVPVAIIVIWSVKFEQYSTYYYNLFKVISGLIQASLVRATKFLDANYEKIYIPSTRILNPEAFTEILKTRAEMKRNKIADYQLVMIEKSIIDFRDLYFKINEGIRAADLVGMQKNGYCYVLLSQADVLAANDVIARFKKLGLNSRLVDFQEAQLDA